MSKSPAVLFYTSDFISGTAFMNFKQRGMYITLLCLQHQQGHLREEDMIELCGGRDEKVFKKFVQDEKGLFYNERMEKEAQKRKIFTESRLKNLRSDLTSPHTECHMDNHMENHMENENINISESNNLIVLSKGISTNLENPPNDRKNDGKIPSLMEERFNRFWKAYPRKVAKGYAFECFKKLKPSEALTQKMLTAIEEQKKSAEWLKNSGEYIPNPSTWLNQGRWEDELSEQKESASVVPKYSQNEKGVDNATGQHIRRYDGITYV